MSLAPTGPRTVWCLAAVVIAAMGCVAGSPPLPGEGDDAGRTVVYRDTWGVPHPYAPTVEEGLYA